MFNYLKNPSHKRRISKNWLKWQTSAALVWRELFGLSDGINGAPCDNLCQGMTVIKYSAYCCIGSHSMRFNILCRHIENLAIRPILLLNVFAASLLAFYLTLMRKYHAMCICKSLMISIFVNRKARNGERLKIVCAKKSVVWCQTNKKDTEKTLIAT